MTRPDNRAPFTLPFDYPWDLALAEERGWDPVAHLAALDDGDIDLIGLTHPTNWLNEDEVENV